MLASKTSLLSDDRSLLNSEDDSNGGSTNMGFGNRNYGTTNRGEELRENPAHIGSIQGLPTRSMSKKGNRNINHKNVHYTERAFWIDIFTTFLDAQWRWLIFAIFVCYFSSWLIFGTVWYTILLLHGDLEPQNLADPNWRPCVTNMEGFTSTFLFSLETQQTTGYGYYHITEKCASAVVTLCIQSIIGVILEGLVVGLVLLKMSRAKKRTATLLFSRDAVIGKRDGHLCFMFRVADLRSTSTLLQATIRAQLVTSRVTLEGEEVPISQEELEVGGDGEKGNNLLLLWPTTIIHRIDERSPLARFIGNDTWDHTSPHFEIIVVLEGVVESTGLVTQARTSYLSSEILWGHRFKSMVPVRPSKAGSASTYIDYTHFHDTYPVTRSTSSEWSY